MGDILQEEMTGQSMVDDIVLNHVTEEGGTKVADIPLFSMTKPFKDRRCVVECLYQLDFGNGKFFTGLQQNIPGNT
jgi:hypothetical protein